ncbi:hypothetical protein ABTD94_21485, partial [Acinetobacter baumannii]
AMGYSIQYPNGWRVANDPKTGRIDVADPNGGELTILPFFTPTKIDALPFFRLFIKTYAPNEQWSNPVKVGANAYRADCANDKQYATAAIVT